MELEVASCYKLLTGTMLHLLCAMMIACRHDGFVGSVARKRICKAQTVKKPAAARMAYHDHGFYLCSIRGWTSSETSLSDEARSSGSVRVARLSYAMQGWLQLSRQHLNQ